MIGNYSIAIVGSYSRYSTGGTSVHPTEIARVLSKRNKVFLVTDGSRKEVIHENDNLTVYVEKAARHGRTSQKIKRAYLIRKNVDLFHIHDPRSGLFGVIERNKPLILTTHGYLTNEAVANKKTTENGLLFKIYLKIQKVSTKRADAVIAVDRRIYEWLMNEIGCDESKLYHIPNGANIDQFSPCIDGSDIRRKYDIAEQGHLIICARHLVSKNGVEYLIKAMPIILKANPNTKLLLAGDGPLKKMLQNLVFELNLAKNVIFCGIVDHDKIPKYYAAANVSVVPSAHVSGVEEATSISLLESMATGKPVVASNIGGLKEILSNKNIGILVPDKNISALAEAIIYTFDYPDKAKRLGQRAREYIVKNHSWDKVAEQVSDVYELALEKYGAV